MALSFQAMAQVGETQTDHGDFPELSWRITAETPGGLIRLEFSEQSTGKGNGIGREPQRSAECSCKYSPEN